jgi:hypothetical protein
VNLVRGYPRVAFIGLLTAGLISTTVAVLPARADEPTVSQDTYRDGWDQSETALDPASVTSPDFGQQFATQLDGSVYAQPLVIGNMLIVATENDKVYGLDRATGAIQWTRDFGPAWPASTIGCSDLMPNLGVTSTPVFDPASGYVYLVTKVNNGPDAMHPHYYMQAVDPASGTEKAGFPVTIGGHPSNDASATFDPAYQGQRPGLLLLGGVVYAGFGSHCDYGPDFRGYVAGVSTSGAQTTLWSDETGAGVKGGGIWLGGGGLVSDGPNQIVIATGNGDTGTSPAPGPGNTPPNDLSESVVRLHVNANGTLSPTDFFSPSNAPTMDANDTDLGSGGPMALPDGWGTAAHPNLIVQMGKDGRLFLLDRGNLGGSGQGAGGTDNVLGKLGPYQGQWGHPAFFGGDGGFVYLIGNAGPLRAFKYGVSGTGLPALSLVGTSVGTFNYTSGSPVVTSNGKDPASAVVWVVWSNGPTGGSAELRAYSAEPNSSGTLNELWSGPIGTAVKFATPATSGGRVYLGTRDGKVLAYGRPTTSVLTGSPVNFGDVPVGQPGSGTLTVTATKDLNITAVSTNSPFAVTPPTLPYHLAAGTSVDIPATFTPGGAGIISGSITVTTDAGAVAFGASGRGTAPGFAANPPNLTFSDQPTGLTSTQNFQVTNTGTATETVAATTPPSAPYTVSGLPAAGTAVAAGGSFVVSVTYAPTATGTNTSSITIDSTSADSSPHTLTVPLNGNAVTGQGHLVISPWPVDFGAVALGSTTTQTFSLHNTGNIPVTITKAKAPISDYTAASPLPEGQVIGPDQVYVQSVTLTPTALGTDADSYEVTADDGQGARFVPLTASVLPTLPAVPTAWQLNGSASLTAPSGTIQLTPAQSFQAGSAFSQLPVATAGLAASFTAQLYGGTGADGMTFSLIDATKNSPGSVGGAGGGLGLDGLNGIGVALDTFPSNQVGIVTGTDNAGGVTWLTSVPGPASLRTGPHTVTVSVSAGAISVFVDGAKLIDSYTPAAGLIPAGAYAGFTGGTGQGTDIHTVGNVVIATGTSAATPVAPVAAPASATIQSVPTGFSELRTVTLTNNGKAPVVITGTTAPSGELSATMLPSIGQVLPAGGSILVHVGFAPTAAGPASGSFSVTTTGGTVIVPLSGATWPPSNGTMLPVH